MENAGQRATRPESMGKTPFQAFNNRLKKLWSPGLVFFGGIALFIAYYFIDIVPRSVRSPYAVDGYWSAVLLVIALYLSIFLHECGHLIGGWLVRFELFEFYCAPFKLIKENGRFKFAWGTWADGLGHVRMLPRVSGDSTEKALWLTWRAFLMVAAGPAVNAGLWLVASMILIRFRTVLWEVDFESETIINAGWLLETFLTNLQSVSIFFLIANLIPISGTGAIQSDGYTILNLLRGGDTAARWLAILNLQRALALRLPPDKWDQGWITQAVVLRDNSLIESSANALAYLAAYWAGRLPEARAYLERALATSNTAPEKMRWGILAEVAYFRLRYGDRLGASELIQKLGNDRLGQVETFTQLRLRALIKIEDGKLAEGRALVETGITNATPQKDLNQILEYRMFLDLRDYLVVREATAGKGVPLDVSDFTVGVDQGVRV